MHPASQHTHDMLRVSLGIRHHLARLLVLAHEISLVSLNAKVSSAQLGQAGSVFSVMTQEIQSIAGDLRHTVEDVRALTHDWTRLAADVALLQDLIRVLEQTGDRHPPVRRALIEKRTQLHHLQRKMPRMTGKLIMIIDDMERSLRVVNYVTVGILIESERISATTDDQQPFDHLAREMQSAAERIRDIASFASKQMNELEQTS